MVTSLNPIFKQRLRRLAGLLAVGLLTTAATTAAASGITFAEDLFPELDEILEQAALSSTGLVVGQLRMEERLGDLEVVRGRQRPQVRLSARLLASYETREDIDNNFRGNVNANLSVTQPLYQWGNLERMETIAEHRVDLEAIDLKNAGASQFMQLRRAYLQWVLMRARRDILVQSIELSESFVDARRQLLEVGQSSEQEVLEMEARLMENRENLAWVEKTMTDMHNILAQHAGPEFNVDRLKGESLDVIQPMSDAAFAELEAMVQKQAGHLNDPVEEKLSLLETIEDEQLAILDKTNWPTVDFVAGIYSDQLDAVNQEEYILRTQYFAGLQLNWSIFDGWQTDGRKRSALARKRSYALQRDEISGNSDRFADTLLAGLQLNLKQMEARSQREQLLERRVRLLREQAQRNLVTGVELIEGEIDYLEVSQRLMDARVNYLMNLMELGVLLDMDPAARYYAPVE